MRQSRRKFLHETGRLTAALTLSPGILRARAGAPPAPAARKTYYVDTDGSNENSGTSEAKPWKDFALVNRHTFSPGDSLLLKRGCVWREELKINGAGNPAQFITVGAYGDGPRPKIQRDGRPTDRCVRLNNASYLKVSSLEVCSGGAGIVLFYDHSYHNQSVYLDDIVAHDFEKIEDPQDRGRVTWSYGIGVTGIEDTANNQTNVLSDFKITSTEVYNTGAGIALDWGNHFCLDGTLALKNKFTDVFMEHLNLHDNTVEGIAFVSLFITSVTRCTIRNSIVDRGARYAVTGSSAIAIMYSKDVTLSNVTISNMPFNPCPDNSGLDFECNNENVIVEGCTFKNNAGPAIEFLATPNNVDPSTRNFVIRNCTFLDNNWARKIGSYQVIVPNWGWGNRPIGKIYDNKYRNPRNVTFLGGDGNCTLIEVERNTNIGKPDPQPTVVHSWNFWEGRSAGWQNATPAISQFHVNKRALEGTIQSVDPILLSEDRLGLVITPETFIRIRMKNGTKAEYGQIYFITDAEGEWDEKKHLDFWLYPEAAGLKTYDVDMSFVSKWSGVLRRLRIDPEQGAASGSFSIDFIQILKR